MNHNYFFSSTDTSMKGLGMTLFGDFEENVLEDNIINSNLNLRLKDDFFTQESPSAPKESYFNFTTPNILGCNDEKKEAYDFAETDIKTSFETSIAPGFCHGDFNTDNVFGSIASERKSFSKEIELQSVDCNFSCSQHSEKDFNINFEKDKITPSEVANAEGSSDGTIADKRTEITDQKMEMAAPQSLNLYTVYKTPNYKGKKRSNINYVTKH
eukprot:CAMPEP_0205821760 /NCGR_PEP_ID=MMETSP0206-20130828/9446_1 /ASSEMBLY_ACC=CAM_ASM_000279 /TAXON_ID=36767 /ORGANISM="Euplotes focardii, Strain TN1" /LENGTH=212 /DNA_ID=CAMNT_0053117483 /DNA_START=24 /DNA_END=662 /DNA_ORIENTATION=+